MNKNNMLILAERKRRQRMMLVCAALIAIIGMIAMVADFSFLQHQPNMIDDGKGSTNGYRIVVSDNLAPKGNSPWRADHASLANELPITGNIFPMDTIYKLNGTRRPLGRRSRGQASVELALSLPLLLMMFLVVVETGRAFYIAISVANAARAGVQYGSQNLSTAGDNAGMQSAAANDAPNLAGMIAVATHFCKCADGSSSTCQATDCAGSHRLLYTQVNTSASYTPLINFMGILPSMTVPGKAVMRVVQ